MPYIKRVTNLIAEDEGFRSRIYKDSKGFDTIGFGFNLNKTELPIGAALLWMDDIVEQVIRDLEGNVTFWHKLNEARQYVLINMAYHMGIAGLLKFKDMLDALEHFDYVKASYAMKDSLWHKEFTTRSNRLINIMIKGEL